MPTTYTHDIFGKEVFKQLPSEIKDAVRESRSMYLIGLHGPDVLFYYYPFFKNKVNRIGYQIHEREAAEFFCQAIVKYQDEPTPQLLSYLLGFGCHFILDSTCHPYINRFERESGVSHAEIETELDRYYMLREGKNPLLYKPAVSICPTMEGCRTLSRVFGKVTEKQVAKALKSMKFYTGLMACESRIKRECLLSLLKITGSYDSMEGQIMREKPSSRCEISTDVLRHLYEDALEEAVDALCNLYDCMVNEGKLSERFDRNFE